jgi:hypothetical protein
MTEPQEHPLDGENPIDMFSLGLAAVDLNDEDATTIWYSLRSHLDWLKNSMATKYDGSEGYSFEDDMHLGGQIGKTAFVLYKLQQAGFEERYNVPKSP